MHFGIFLEERRRGVSEGATLRETIELADAGEAGGLDGVWLDYAFPLVLRRLAARTVRRAVTGEVLWNGNREYFWEHCRVWSERSLFHWLFKTYWAYRRELPVLFAQPGHTHLRIARLRRPRETEAWLAGLAPE